MHGRRRVPVGADHMMDEESAKAAKAFALVKAALKARKAGPVPENIVTAANAVLTRNPEVYSLWNLKREVLIPVMSTEAASATVAKELQIVDQCLQKNHKSYAAWQQRQWLVEKGHTDLHHEIKCVEKQHLSQVHGDPKNFHAWKYRSWLCAQVSHPPQLDLDYTRDLLQADPSNFSAWHHRMAALCACSDAAERSASPHESQAEAAAPTTAAEGTTAGQDPGAAPVARHGTRVMAIPLETIESELKFLHDLLTIDPANSSSWSYHLWLLACALAHLPPSPPPSSELPPADTQHRIKNILEAERAACESIARAEAARVEILVASKHGAKQANTETHNRGADEASSGRGNDELPAGVGSGKGEGGRKGAETAKTDATGADVEESITVSIARVAHVRALQALADVLRLQGEFAQATGTSGSSSSAEADAYKKLAEIDPRRAGFYHAQLALLQP